MPNNEIVKTNPDPTKNVLDLVNAAIRRQDDLMAAESLRVDQLIVEKEKESIQRWTSLKELIESGLTATEKAVNVALSNQKEALQKAENATERRFESVNEFRNTLGDQQRTLMPRSEVEVIIKAQDSKIDAVQARLDKTEGKGTGVSQSLGWILAAITILGFIISNALRIN